MLLLGICPRAMRLTFTQKTYVNTYRSSLHSHSSGKMPQMSFSGPGCVDRPVVRLQDGAALNRTNCWNVSTCVSTALDQVRPGTCMARPAAILERQHYRDKGLVQG